MEKKLPRVTEPFKPAPFSLVDIKSRKVAQDFVFADMNANICFPNVAAALEEEEEPLLIYTAQGSPFRCKKLSVINGSPERNNVLKLCIHMHYTNTNNNIDRRLCTNKRLEANEYEKYHQDSSLKRVQP